MSDVLYCRQEVLMRCIPVATVMLACVQVIRVDGVQAAKASLLEMRLESRWFHSELLSNQAWYSDFPRRGCIHVGYMGPVSWSLQGCA